MSRSTKQALIGLGAIAVVLVVIAVIAIQGNNAQGLRAQVLSTRRAEPGEKVDITVAASDSSGVVTRVEVDFGDGNSAVSRDRRLECPTELAYTDRFDFSHTYTERGTFTVRALVVSGECSAQVEQVEAVRTIDVKPLNVR